VLDPVARQPDLTLQEIRGALAVQHGITVGLRTLWRFLIGRQIMHKKRACTRPSSIAAA
jgi:transposase